MQSSQAQLVTIKKALSFDGVIPFGASNFCLWSPDVMESNWSDLCHGPIHVKQVFLLSGSDWSYNQRRALFVNSFLTTMSTPDNCRHRRWVFGYLTNFSFVPRASIQPHSSRQQLNSSKGSILILASYLLRIFIFLSWWTLSLTEAGTLYTAVGCYWVATHTWTHSHHSTEMFLSRAPVISRFPALLGIFLAVSYSASQQPWTSETCHPEALPFKVSTTLHSLVFLGHAFSLSSVDGFQPLNVSISPLGLGHAPPFPFLLSILFLGDFKYPYDYKHNG